MFAFYKICIRLLKKNNWIKISKRFCVNKLVGGYSVVHVKLLLMAWFVVVVILSCISCICRQLLKLDRFQKPVLLLFSCNVYTSSLIHLLMPQQVVCDNKRDKWLTYHFNKILVNNTHAGRFSFLKVFSNLLSFYFILVFFSMKLLQINDEHNYNNYVLF